VTENVGLRPVLEKSELLRVIKGGALVPSARSRDCVLSDRTREELVRLVQRLFLSPDSDGPNTVVFSAVEQGGGCSWTCARIAEILADRTDRLVCLIDANYRSKRPYEEFKCESPATLFGEEWSFVPISRSTDTFSSNFWLLSYRPVPPVGPTAASLERFRARITELRKEFSYVLIDAPPLNSYMDAALFGRMADGAMLVFEANSTRREPARKAKEVLDQSGVPVLGAVLNKRVFPIPEPVYRRL
jgi:Mrp family chromosome partitioning ATPase